MKEHRKDFCPLCKGEKKDGTTTFTADLGFGVIVVRNVPATICTQCGTDWIPDKVAAKLEELVESTREKRMLVEVLSFQKKVG